MNPNNNEYIINKCPSNLLFFLQTKSITYSIINSQTTNNDLTFLSELTRLRINMKSFKCDGCDKIFINAGNLRSHIYEMHDDQRKYKCEICEKMFELEESYKEHVTNYHENEITLYCNVCSKEFQSHKKLDIHLQKFHKILNECYLCHKVCRSKYDLSNHISRVHKGDKPYQCDICEEKFSTKEIF